jgi:hypothetical protein
MFERQEHPLPPHQGWLVIAAVVVVGGVCFFSGVSLTREAYADGWNSRKVLDEAILQRSLDSLHQELDSICVAWHTTAERAPIAAP